MEAMTIHINSRNTNPIIKKIPTMRNISGIHKSMYNAIDNWKLRLALPFLSTHSESSFLDSQKIIGPIMPPNGKK